MNTNVVSTHSFDPEDEALRIDSLNARQRHHEMLAEHAHRKDERRRRHHRGDHRLKFPAYCLK